MPLQCEALSHRGVGQLLETVEDVRMFANADLKVLGVVATMFDGRTRHARQVLDEVGTRYGLTVLRPSGPQVGAVRRGAGRGPVDPPARARARPVPTPTGRWPGRSASCWPRADRGHRRNPKPRRNLKANGARPAGDPLGKRALFWIARSSMGTGPLLGAGPYWRRVKRRTGRRSTPTWSSAAARSSVTCSACGAVSPDRRPRLPHLPAADSATGCPAGGSATA